MSAPYYFDTINEYESHIIPSELKPANNAMSLYYRRYLAQRAFSVYEFKNLPENWNAEYLMFILFAFGRCAVVKTDIFGIIPQQCEVYGYNVYYRPTHALVTNPLFDKTYDLKIGEECELVRLSPDWRGIPDLIGHYADQMALVTSCIISNLYNSRLAYVFGSENKAFSDTFKTMYDKIQKGQPAVFVSKDLFNDAGEPTWFTFQQDLKSNYITDLLQGAQRCLVSQFYSEIGIPNIPYEKTERLNMAESEINSYATQCLVDLWKRTMNSTLDKVNKLFGLNVSVDYNKQLKEVSENGNDRSDNPGGNAEL